MQRLVPLMVREPVVWRAVVMFAVRILTEKEVAKREGGWTTNTAGAERQEENVTDGKEMSREKLIDFWDAGRANNGDDNR